MTNVRDFKGIWIPKEIWMNKDLSVMEKLFLVEIDSLDGDKGCFASNAHFSEMFDISKGRCTQIIKSLEAKKYIKIALIRDGKTIKSRLIRVVNKLNRVVNKLNHPSENIKSPYLENAEGNNTKDNNTNTNTVVDFDEEFKQIKKSYPRGSGEVVWEGALTWFKKYREANYSFEEILKGVLRYQKYCDATSKTGTRYVKRPHTFFNKELFFSKSWSESSPTTPHVQQKSNVENIIEPAWKREGFETEDDWNRTLHKKQMESMGIDDFEVVNG